MFGFKKSPSRVTSYEDTYRTNDGRAKFRFRFVEEANGTWRADIEAQPGYGSRANGLHASHRLSSTTAGTGHKICYATEPRNLRDARKWAEAWAEATWVWITEGRRVKGF